MLYIAKVHYSENTAKPFAEYLGWQQGRLARVRVTQFFSRKTIQPVNIGVICLYVRSLHCDGFGVQTRHNAGSTLHCGRNAERGCLTMPEIVFIIRKIVFIIPKQIFPFCLIVFIICAEKVCYKVCNMYYKVCNMC